MSSNSTGKPPNLDEIWEDVQRGIIDKYGQKVMVKARYMELYTYF
jgi:hypothetical protein